MENKRVDKDIAGKYTQKENRSDEFHDGQGQNVTKQKNTLQWKLTVMKIYVCIST